MGDLLSYLDNLLLVKDCRGNIRDFKIRDATAVRRGRK